MCDGTFCFSCPEVKDGRYPYGNLPPCPNDCAACYHVSDGRECPMVEHDRFRKINEERYEESK